jgi:hypothetical protein
MVNVRVRTSLKGSPHASNNKLPSGFRWIPVDAVTGNIQPAFQFTRIDCGNSGVRITIYSAKGVKTLLAGPTCISCTDIRKMHEGNVT